MWLPVTCCSGWLSPATVSHSAIITTIAACFTTSLILSESAIIWFCCNVYFNYLEWFCLTSWDFYSWHHLMLLASNVITLMQLSYYSLMSAKLQVCMKKEKSWMCTMMQWLVCLWLISLESMSFNVGTLCIGLINAWLSLFGSKPRWTVPLGFGTVMKLLHSLVISSTLIGPAFVATVVFSNSFKVVPVVCMLYAMHLGGGWDGLASSIVRSTFETPNSYKTLLNSLCMSNDVLAFNTVSFQVWTCSKVVCFLINFAVSIGVSLNTIFC